MLTSGAARDAVPGLGRPVAAPHALASELATERHDHREPLREPVELEAVIGAELVLQPRARRRDADALLQRGQRILRQPHAVVAHLDPELVVLAARA